MNRNYDFLQKIIDLNLNDSYVCKRILPFYKNNKLFYTLTVCHYENRETHLLPVAYNDPKDPFPLNLINLGERKVIKIK